MDHIVNTNKYDGYNHQSMKVSDALDVLSQPESNTENHVYDPSQFYYDDEYDDPIYGGCEDSNHTEQDEVKRAYTNNCGDNECNDDDNNEYDPIYNDCEDINQSETDDVKRSYTNSYEDNACDDNDDEYDSIKNDCEDSNQTSEYSEQDEVKQTYTINCEDNEFDEDPVKNECEVSNHSDQDEVIRTFTNSCEDNEEYDQSNNDCDDSNQISEHSEQDVEKRTYMNACEDNEEYDQCNNDCEDSNQIGEHSEQDEIKRRYEIHCEDNECDDDDDHPVNNEYEVSYLTEQDEVNLNENYDDGIENKDLTEKSHEESIERNINANLFEDESNDDELDEEVIDNKSEKKTVINRNRKRYKKEHRIDSDEDYDFEQDLKEGNYEETDDDIILDEEDGDINNEKYIKNVYGGKINDSDREMIDDVRQGFDSSESSNGSDSDIEYEMEEEEEFVNEDYYIVDSSDDEEYVGHSNVVKGDGSTWNSSQQNLKPKESLGHELHLKNTMSLKVNNSKNEIICDEGNKIRNRSIGTISEKNQRRKKPKSCVKLFESCLTEPQNSNAFLYKDHQIKKPNEERFVGFTKNTKETHRMNIKNQILLHQIRNAQKKLNIKNNDYFINNGIDDKIDFSKYDRKFFHDDLNSIFCRNPNKKTDKTIPLNNHDVNSLRRNKNNKYEIIKRKQSSSKYRKYDDFIEVIKIKKGPVEKRKRGRPCKIVKSSETTNNISLEIARRKHILLMKALDKELQRFEQFIKIEKERIDQGLDYQCSVCYQIFEQNTNLKKHFYKCLNKYTQTQIKTPFKCVICGEYFSFLNNLEKHINEKHMIDAEDKIYQCGHCSTCYLTKNLLFDHVLSSHEIIQCIYCDKYYKTQQDLNEHLKKKHNVEIEERIDEIVDQNQETNVKDTYQNEVIRENESLPVVKRGRGRPKKNCIESNCVMVKVKEEPIEEEDQIKEDNSQLEQEQTENKNQVQKEEDNLENTDISQHIVEEQHQLIDKIKEEKIDTVSDSNILENKIVQVRRRGRPKLKPKLYQFEKIKNITIENQPKQIDIPSGGVTIKQEFIGEIITDSQEKTSDDISNDIITKTSDIKVKTNIDIIENKIDSKVILDENKIVVKKEKEELVPHMDMNEFGRGRRIKKPKLIDYDETIASITSRKRKISDNTQEQNHQDAKKIKMDESLIISSIVVNTIKNNNKTVEHVKTIENIENRYTGIDGNSVKKDIHINKIPRKQIRCLKCDKLFMNKLLCRRHNVRFHNPNNIHFNELNKRNIKNHSHNKWKKRTADKIKCNEIQKQIIADEEIDDVRTERTRVENKLHTLQEKSKLEVSPIKMSIRIQNSTERKIRNITENTNENSTENSANKRIRNITENSSKKIDLNSIENTKQNIMEKGNRMSTENTNEKSREKINMDHSVKRNLNSPDKRSTISVDGGNRYSTDNTNQNITEKRNLNRTEKVNLHSPDKRNINNLEKKHLNGTEKLNRHSPDKRNINSTENTKQNSTEKRNPCREKSVDIEQNSEIMKPKINLELKKNADNTESLDTSKSLIIYESLSKRYSPKNFPPSQSNDKHFFKCFFCPVKYVRHSQLDKHFISHHNGYPCYVCHTIMKTRPLLDKHLFLCHKENERYKCCVCFKFMKSKQTLRKHFYMHEDRRPYDCEICKTSFRYSYDMRLHMNRTHYKIINSVNTDENEEEEDEEELV